MCHRLTSPAVFVSSASVCARVCVFTNTLRRHQGLCRTRAKSVCEDTNTGGAETLAETKTQTLAEAKTQTSADSANTGCAAAVSHVRDPISACQECGRCDYVSLRLQSSSLCNSSKHFLSAEPLALKCYPLF